MRPSKLAGMIGLLCLAACITDVAPLTRVLGPLDLHEPPILFVSANRDQEHVVDSLTRAGFAVTQELRSANLVLEARLGAKKSDSPCGVVRNVIYILRERGTPILQLKGRGGTGLCPDNILDQMSQQLARPLEVPNSDREPV
jgi:hypothetical protein